MRRHVAAYIEQDRADAQRPGDVEIGRAIVDEDDVARLRAQDRQHLPIDLGRLLAHAEVAADEPGVDPRFQAEPHSQLLRPVGNVVGQAGDAAEVRLEPRQGLERVVDQFVSGKVIVLQRRIDAHACPELRRADVAEACREIGIVDLRGREAGRAMPVHERHQQLGYVVARPVEHAHGVEDQNVAAHFAPSPLTAWRLRCK